MLEIYDRNRKKLAILQNAFNISETMRINAIENFFFSLPDTDKKNQYCEAFNLIRYNDGELYRIMPTKANYSEIGSKSYECEHVIATLIDKIMFGFHQVGGLGYYTKDVINYVLSQQINKDWILDECDFSRQFEYGWEQENLLAALFGIPKPFTELYKWTFDTKHYPYKLSLKRLDENKNPDRYIRRGENRLTLTKQSDPKQICTRLYPLGAGEGVYQLGIKELNNNLPYIQSPQSIIDEYGIVERVWIDRRYTDQQSLLDAAKAMLHELQEPIKEYEADFMGDCKVGEIVKIVELDKKSFITGIQRNHDEVLTQKITIANKPKDIADTVADLADRQRIESTYSQGASQTYTLVYTRTADASNRAEMPFYVHRDMLFIESVNLKIKIRQYMSWTGNMQSGGALQTTSDGGGTYTSTESGGSVYTSTGSGGSVYTSSGSGGGAVSTSGLATEVQYGTHYSLQNPVVSGQPAQHIHPIGDWTVTHKHVTNVPSHTHTIQTSDHSHTISISTHYHNITIPTHTHTVSIAAHNHTVTIGNHSHTLNTAHTHTLAPALTRHGNPTGFWLYVFLV